MTAVYNGDIFRNTLGAQQQFIQANAASSAFTYPASMLSDFMKGAGMYEGDGKRTK